MKVVKDMDGFGLLVETLGSKLTSATWPLLGGIPPLDVAKDGPKTSAVTVVYTDQRQERFDKNLRQVTTVTYVYFFTLNFPFL